jgi:putative transcriptional regulator
MTPDLKIEKGNVLVGKPNILGDATFNRAVILIVDFNDDGVVGFIVNKPIEDNLKDLLPEVEKDFMVFDGGPVEKDKLYFLHNKPDLIVDSIKITEDLYWGGDYRKVVDLINNAEIDHHNIKFFLGYSGWAEMQLESEIQNEVWHLQNHVESSEILVCDRASYWNEVVKKIGGEFLIWSNAPENFNYN